jgi:hypothetical protein
MVCWCLIDGAMFVMTTESRKKERTEGRAEKKYRTRQILLGLKTTVDRLIPTNPSQSAYLLPARQVSLQDKFVRTYRERPGKARDCCFFRLGVIARHYVAIQFQPQRRPSGRR